ncbi:hypothetical protein [Delftia acidovorans]|uniref:hypothetical protein n=1 Tax=Delftia acidovorans TaxID=80866 RepID=UPI00286F802F|nr:hypothetical protein [Delftia acidovorans]
MKPRLQFIGGLWRCAEPWRLEQDRLHMGWGAPPVMLAPIGWDRTPQEAYEMWDHFRQEEVIERRRFHQRLRFMERARGSSKARLLRLGEKWLCASRRQYPSGYQSEAEGSTALEAYQGWKAKTCVDHLVKLMEQPSMEPDTRSALRLAAFCVAAVIALTVFLWMAVASITSAISPGAAEQSCLERSPD